MLQTRNDMVLIVPDEAKEKSSGGIILAEISKQKPNYGTVKSFGHLVNDLSFNDKVLYSKFSGQEVVMDDGIVALILNEKEIIGKIT